MLILDTARFKYPPHWVPLQELHEAMAALDSSTQRPRGWLVLTQRQQPLSVMFTLDASSRWGRKSPGQAPCLQVACLLYTNQDSAVQDRAATAWSLDGRAEESAAHVQIFQCLWHATAGAAAGSCQLEVGLAKWFKADRGSA